MATKILPQAVISIPRIPNQCTPRRLGFCSAISCTRLSFSTLSSSSIGCHFHHTVSAPMKRAFVVRAEADSEAESASDEKNVERSVGEAPQAVVEAVAVSDGQPEAEKPPRKPRVKLGDVLGILNKRAIEASEKARPIPDIRTGDIVEIKLEVPENRRRLSVYRGIVMSKQNAGIHTTIRIRRIIAGVGVEIVFPLYSPNIKELKVVSHRKVRRARLYYLRDKLPRLSTFK
ncbi:50S ribosomal protein L19-1, chloroplastic-like [Cucurbita pepo subsp. pepo]|uniref:50S ribosomal protein L19-1, chloroplastic-like n=1 Tax=Cucurbita pepo subsp. pepo TaxID=3664 RepID=UPI000C9D5524|nr:50S ribosomal protein L19-1, chloroplastic-like [Cucurbita pepo subsp. pepo]